MVISYHSYIYIYTYILCGCRADDIHWKETCGNASINRHVSHYKIRKTFVKIMHAALCDCVTEVTAIWVVVRLCHYGLLRSSLQFVATNSPVNKYDKCSLSANMLLWYNHYWPFWCTWTVSILFICVIFIIKHVHYSRSINIINKYMIIDFAGN